MSDKPSITRVVKFIKKGESGNSVIVADTTSRHYTYAQWKRYGTTGHLETWGSVNNADKFRVGDTIVINGVCTDKGNIGVSLYATVGAVNIPSKSVTATTTSLIMGGENGEPGSNAVTYEFVMTDTYYRVDAKGFVSARLKGALYQIVGGSRTPISGAALTFGYTNPGYDKEDHPTTTTSTKGTFTDDDWFTGDEYANASMCNKSSSIFVCYGDINAPTAIFTVAVVFDGSNGSDGAKGDRGPALRGPQDWGKCAVGFSFQAGGDNEEYKDVVVYNGNYYSCIKSHVKKSSNYPTSAEDTQNGYWRLGDKLELIATQILLSTYALVKNLGVEVVEMKNSNGQVVFQAKNGNVTCNTGTFKNVNVSGVINADMMYSKTVTISTANATAYTIDPEREPGTTFIVKNPTRNFWIQLPDAEKYDGLEIQIFTLTSNFNYRTYIRSQSGDALNIKPNIYNIPKDNGVSGFVAVEDYNATYYRSAAGNDPWMMQPNMVYKFKSMAGEWYALEGLFTGE